MQIRQYINILAPIILILAFYNKCSGQSFNYSRDFNKYLDESKDSSSKFFYPTLLNRFNKNDSTLTGEEMLALEIGFTYNKNYKPYETLIQEREICQLVDNEKFPEAITKCDSLLITNPLSLTALEEKYFSYRILNNDSSNFYLGQSKKIILGLKYSGIGSYQSPMFVLGPADGQLLVTSIYGKKILSMGSGTDANGNLLDIIQMEYEDQKLIHLYFIIPENTALMKSIEDVVKTKNANGEKFTMPK